MPGQRERLPAVHGARLEDAVADRQPVVDGGHDRLVLGAQTAVGPDHDAHGRQSGAEVASAIETGVGLELGLGPLRVGVAPPRDARAGAEAQGARDGGGGAGAEAGVVGRVVPGPPEGPDADGELGAAGVGVDPADDAAVRAARDRLQGGDDPQRRALGRARDRARAGRSRPAGAPTGRPPPGRRSASRPWTVETRWTRPGCSSSASSDVDLDRPRGAHALQVVADEVGDHDVLGAVLGRSGRPPSTAVPLMGAEVRTPSSRRRYSSGDAVTTQAGGSPVAAGTWTPPANGAGLPCASRAARARGDGSSPAVPASGAESTRQTFDLVDVARAHVPAHPLDGGDVRVPVQRGAPRRRGRAVPRRRRGGRGVVVPDVGEAPRAHRAVEVADHRPEPAARHDRRVPGEVDALDAPRAWTPRNQASPSPRPARGAAGPGVGGGAEGGTRSPYPRSVRGCGCAGRAGAPEAGTAGQRPATRRPGGRLDSRGPGRLKSGTRPAHRPARDGKRVVRTWLSGRASPCQGEGRGFESRRPLGGPTPGRLPGARESRVARWSGREARQRPAKPSTRVRIPSPPLQLQYPM